MSVFTSRPMSVIHAIAMVAAFGGHAAGQTASPVAPLRQFDAAMRGRQPSREHEP
jgi:hypothetical protein